MAVEPASHGWYGQRRLDLDAELLAQSSLARRYR
jgi:hypothetical protein